MAEPLVRSLKLNFPDCEIDILVSNATAQVYKNHASIRRTIVLEKAKISFAKLIYRLHKNKYDVFLGCIPSNTYSQILAPVLSRIPVRVKHRTPHQKLRDLDFLFHGILPIPDGKHRLECNLDLLQFFSIKAEASNPQFIIDSNIRKIIDDRLPQYEGLTIGFHPGCSPSASFKRWLPANYAALGDCLVETHGCRIIIVGGVDEREDVNQLYDAMRNKPINFCGTCTLEETAAVIKRCDCFISNDSGIMHLATAVNVRTFAIFGPKDERHIGPYGPIHTVIRNGKDVSNVTVEQVISVLENSVFGLKKHHE